MTTRPKNWRQDLIDIEVDSWSDLTVSKPTVEVKLTERELTLLIEELEVNKEVYEQMIREEQERGNEPYPRHLEVLDLLTRLHELRGDF